jgi:hypothetical protein
MGGRCHPGCRVDATRKDTSPDLSSPPSTTSGYTSLEGPGEDSGPQTLQVQMGVWAKLVQDAHSPPEQVMLQDPPPLPSVTLQLVAQLLPLPPSPGGFLMDGSTAADRHRGRVMRARANTSNQAFLIDGLLRVRTSFGWSKERGRSHPASGHLSVCARLACSISSAINEAVGRKVSAWIMGEGAVRLTLLEAGIPSTPSMAA